MAIKDQCLKCTHYTNHQCAISAPVYDSTSCALYANKGINLEKGDANSAYSQNTPLSSIATTPENTKPQSMFASPFSFKGRIRRKEFCLSYLIYCMYCLPMQLMPEDTDDTGWGIFALLWLMFLIPMCWFMIAQMAKRCHDRGNSAWYMLIPFYIYWLLFAAGDEGVNQYGDSPK